MILIPEIETVVILVPRTGSGSLRRAIAATYPRAMQIYRHMEADGVPAGYDRWRRIGVVREPLARLWSLYKFMRSYRHPKPDQGAGYIAKLRSSAERPFEDWLLTNEAVFTNPYDTDGGLTFYPQYNVGHSLPENRKSQFIYLRPDLGTEVFPFSRMETLEASLKINLGRTNVTDDQPPPALSLAAAEHMLRFFAWDMTVTGERHD
ncbi:hypothetical protein AncyloWKF20_05345 [Ancylobacter sp. WKF20]|uniref:hypothetical protein n=1 Tax=Ancylobacter sp. WKF20 TaxID=3039801 RepID=UPI0024343D7F|nr:hypothetical protein [Ancylobacter sp. WKF20]WGD31250.1 hypothetical protein AncyloWKF20_05345 [Ancylobacter sp. WKF20]